MILQWCSASLSSPIRRDATETVRMANRVLQLGDGGRLLLRFDGWCASIIGGLGLRLIGDVGSHGLACFPSSRLRRSSGLGFGIPAGVCNFGTRSPTRACSEFLGRESLMVISRPAWFPELFRHNRTSGQNIQSRMKITSMGMNLPCPGKMAQAAQMTSSAANASAGKANVMPAPAKRGKPDVQPMFPFAWGFHVRYLLCKPYTARYPNEA